MTTPRPSLKTVVISMDINRELWEKFSKFVDKKHGKGHKTKVVQKLICKYMRKHGLTWVDAAENVKTIKRINQSTREKKTSLG